MKKQNKNIHFSIKIINNILVDLPTPTSISYIWNWGSILGLIIIFQTLTGILLASYYNSRIENAFSSIIHISRDISYGYVLRFLHINLARFFFIVIFLHISRNILFSSFKLKHTWISGVIILLILIGTAFLGYVLPWGQISFWGATVITNLLSAIPYLGNDIVQWLWGGFSINIATLRRFFALHYLLPFILIALIIIHLASLHETGSNKPTGNNPNTDKINFHPYFSIKDSISILIIILIVITISIKIPFIIGDPENFNPANPLNTPIHIQPEWYFLFAYAILRSIPNKLGGVIALLISIIILFALIVNKKHLASKKFNPNKKIIFWVFRCIFIILTWIGANPVEPPFENIGKLFRLLYFTSLILN